MPNTSNCRGGVTITSLFILVLVVIFALLLVFFCGNGLKRLTADGSSKARESYRASKVETPAPASVAPAAEAAPEAPTAEPAKAGEAEPAGQPAAAKADVVPAAESAPAATEAK